METRIDDPYKAPEAVALDGPALADPHFYVVAPRKFLLLMVGTLGLYALYWFYKNWATLNRHEYCYWPVPRAIFAIFFTHSLFGKIDGMLAAGRKQYAWDATSMAWLFVISTVATQFIHRATMRGFIDEHWDVLGLLLLIPSTYALYRAQGAINLAESDPEGLANAEITGANVLWLLLGGVLWLLNLIGLYEIFIGGLLT